MLLAPMQFKNYVWPHNPKKYSITFRRAMSSDKMPFAHYHMQNVGLNYRVMAGEGEFIGDNAYDQFRELASVFCSDGPGLLVHPVWQPANAHFVSLELLQQPEVNYVAYRFEFWEDTQKHKSALRSGTDPSPAPLAAVKPITVYTTGHDETVWTVAKKNSTTAEKVLRDNPKIRNPNNLPFSMEVFIN